MKNEIDYLETFRAVMEVWQEEHKLLHRMLSADLAALDPLAMRDTVNRAEKVRRKAVKVLL